MGYTEFYCDPTNGSNTNAGSTNAAPLTPYTGGTWVSATGVFTLAGANLASVTVGMFAAVMRDGGTVAALIGRITAVDDTLDTATISTTAKSGSLADGTSNTTLTVGGYWKGPNGAVNFPAGFIAAVMTNAAGDNYRVNMINNATYAVTAAVTHNVSGPGRFEGCTSVAGDGGRATIDGGGNNIANIFTTTGTYMQVYNIITSNVGVSAGSGQGLTLGGNRQVACGCVAHDVRGAGIYASGSNATVLESEAYLCNKSNASNSNRNGIYMGADGGIISRCISHDNAGSNSCGFGLDAGVAADHLVAETNGCYGLLLGDAASQTLAHLDVYNNVSDGINIANTSAMNLYIENCNLVKNGGWGINGAGAGARTGRITNCGYGSGTQVNTSGTHTGLKSMDADPSPVIYASGVTPWTDPANGDFRINLAAAKSAGRGAFTQTQASYAGTSSAEDIGAAHSAAAAAGGGGGILKSSIIHSSMS